MLLHLIYCLKTEYKLLDWQVIIWTIAIRLTYTLVQMHLAGLSGSASKDCHCQQGLSVSIISWLMVMEQQTDSTVKYDFCWQCQQGLSETHDAFTFAHAHISIKHSRCTITVGVTQSDCFMYCTIACIWSHHAFIITCSGSPLTMFTFI